MKTSATSLQDLPRVLAEASTGKQLDAAFKLVKQQEESETRTKRFNDLNHQLQELKPLLRKHHLDVSALELKLKSTKIKLSHLPTNKKLQTEQLEIVEQLSARQIEQAELIDTSNKLRQELQAIIRQRELERMTGMAIDRPITLPIDDPLELLLSISDLARGWQRREIGKRKIYNNMVDRTYRRDETGGTANGMAPPEIEDGAISRLEEIRRQLENITVLRIAAERAFYTAMEELPEGAPFVPKLLTIDDTEAEARYEQWQDQRKAQQSLQRQIINDGHHEITALEKGIYRPAQFSQQIPQNELPDL